jgi:carboxyl-terminal processing protease
MKKLILCFVVLALLFSLTLSFGFSLALAELTPEQQKLNLESFEYVWITIRDKHYDTTFSGLNWQGIHDELKPKMENAKDMQEVRGVLRDMISRLGLSHFGIISKELYKNIDRPAQKGDLNGVTGMDARVIEGKPLVTKVEMGTPAYVAGIKPGWEIQKIREEEISVLLPPIAQEFEKSHRKDYYLASAVRSRLNGIIGDSLKIVFLDENNQKIEKVLPLVERIGKKAIFGHLPPVYLTFKIDTLEKDIGYFQFSCFFDPVTLMPAFNNFMQSFMQAPGLIIDLRGNPGGIGGMATGMIGWFVEEKNLYLGTLSTRDTQLKLIVNPRLEIYKGPIAVLVDCLSGSASEFFAGGIQDLGRAKIFGTRTVGAALPSTIEKLPNGDGFQYVNANYVSKSGKVLEGNGVTPEIEVFLTQEALLKGKDPVIEKALEWIKNQNYKSK